MERKISKLVEKLKEIKEVRAVILFGSYARGEQKPYSDIDICVFTEKNTDERIKEKILSYSSKEFHLSIFWDLPLNFRFRVFKEGKILFVRNPSWLDEIKFSTLRKYLDFRQRFERMAEYYLNKKWLE